jgi:D-alanine-D-alanine ligase
LSEKEEQRINDVAKRVYKVLRMSGFSRSEFILIGGEPYLLEMNTVPGLTSQSLLPQQANIAGISLTELFGNAIEMTLK